MSALDKERLYDAMKAVEDHGRPLTATDYLAVAARYSASYDDPTQTPRTTAGLNLWEWFESDALPLGEFGFTTGRAAIVAIETEAGLDAGPEHGHVGRWCAACRGAERQRIRSEVSLLRTEDGMLSFGDISDEMYAAVQAIIEAPWED